MPDEELEDLRSPLLKKLDKIDRDHMLITERVKTIEDSFLRHLNFHEGMQSGMESIHAKLSINGVMLAELRAGLEEQKKEVKNLWDFPKNSLTIIGLLSGAVIGVYKFWSWALHAIEVKTK